MTDSDPGVASYQYDSTNRLTSLTTPFDETTDFTYDALGRLTRQDNENGTYSTWTFDDAGVGADPREHLRPGEQPARSPRLARRYESRVRCAEP